MSGVTTASMIAMGAAVAGSALSAAGAIQQGRVANAAGDAAAVAADYQAKQMAVNAGQERASAQRKAIEATHQKDLVKSRAQAISAASGGGTIDPSVVDIMGDLESEGKYNADVALYEGEERARDLETGASVKKYEGAQAKAAGKMQRNTAYVGAAGSLLKSGASIYDTYKNSNYK